MHGILEVGTVGADEGPEAWRVAATAVRPYLRPVAIPTVAVGRRGVSYRALLDRDGPDDSHQGAVAAARVLWVERKRVLFPFRISIVSLFFQKSETITFSNRTRYNDTFHG